MRKEGHLFDDLARVAGGAASSLSALREENEALAARLAALEGRLPAAAEAAAKPARRRPAAKRKAAGAAAAKRPRKAGGGAAKKG